MFDSQHNSMIKTQTFMMSTLAPISTPRKRYHNLNSQISKRKSVIAKTINLQNTHIAASYSKEHQAQLKTPNLPELKKQKHFALQQWLNQALQEEGDAVSKEPLRNIKKYSLDKATLRNMQLSHQSIQKLYKGLFVYSSGIKNAFQEMFMEAQTMPRQDNILPKMYFKAFVKLFQNIVPVKSCFQLVEAEYIKNNTEMKKTMMELRQIIESQRHQKQEMERKLKKEIQQRETKINTLMIDYKIMVSSLQLYEKSFAEEVQLRLKFQQKINQTYASYDELKNKFDTMKQELVYSRQLLHQGSIASFQTKEKIQDLTIHNHELNEKIKRLQETISQRQNQLLIKNQQILDIRLVNQSQEEKKQAEENALSELLTEINLQKKEKRQAYNKYQEQVIKNKQQLKLIEKLKGDLVNVREKNDQLYIKYHEAILKIVPIQKEVQQKDIILVENKKQIALIKSKNGLLDIQKEQFEKTINQLKIQVQNLSKDLSLTKIQIEKMSLNIVLMKQVKDRFERISEKLKEDLKVLRLQNEAQIKQNASQKQNNTELNFVKSALQKKISEFQLKIYNLGKDLMEKQQTIKEYKKQEQARKVTLEQTLGLKQKQIEAKNNSYRKLIEELTSKQSEKLKKLEELSYLKKHNENMKQQLTVKQNKLQENLLQIQKRDIQIDRLKKQLANRQFTLNKKKVDIDGEIVNLKTTIVNLKQKIKNRSQYVHPMFIEDLNQQITRLHQKIDKILNENRQMRKNYEYIQRQLKNKREQVRYGAVQVNKLTKNIQISNRQLLIAKEQMKQSQIQFQKKMQERQSQLKREHHELKIQRQKFNDVLRLKQNELNLKEGKIANLQHQIKLLELNFINKKQVILTSKQQQTQIHPFQKKQIKKQFNEIAIQIDLITNGGGRKLTTSDRLRQKKTSLVQQQTMNKHNEIRTSHLPQIHQENQRKQIEKYKWHSREHKIDDKQYKAALKFTYMRN